MLDCLIIGCGPAGISAALTLKANGVHFHMVGLQKVSHKVEKAERISNYPALISVSGEEFTRALRTQMEREEIPFTKDRVTGVYAMGKSFVTLTESGKNYESKTVILAVGVESAGKIDGEERFLGRGVSYCATCDGMLYKEKTIAVVATAKHFEEEVKFLATLADKLYYIPLYKGCEIQEKNVQILKKIPREIRGEQKVTSLVFADESLPIDGMFMLKDSVPPMALVGGLSMEDSGHVRVERDGSTNLKGLYCAGDCTGRPYQYAKAVGEGNVAAHSVSAYLRKKD